MQIKKIIIILIVFLLCGCTANKDEINEDNQDLEESLYIEPITNTNTIPELGDKINEKLTKYVGDLNDAFIGESLNLIGKEIEIYDLKAFDLYGNEVDFEKYRDSKVLLEIAATYCNHCGEQLEFIPEIKKQLGDDIDIVQLFADRNGNAENILKFYENNNHKIENDILIVQYDSALVENITKVGITQTPTFMFIEDGIIKFALSSFNKEHIKSICDVAFTNTIKREEIVDKDGRPLEAFFRNYQTVKNEIDRDSFELLNKFYIYNDELVVNFSGKYFNFYDVTSDYGDGYVKYTSFPDYDNKSTIIFGLSCDTVKELENQITKINDFLNNNNDVNGLVIFLDDTEYFLTSTSSLYLESNVKTICPAASSRSSVPYQIDDIAYQCISKENAPMILCIENNYITGLVAGVSTLDNLDLVKNMFFGENCITLKKNLNRNY